MCREENGTHNKTDRYYFIHKRKNKFSDIILKNEGSNLASISGPHICSKGRRFFLRIKIGISRHSRFKIRMQTGSRDFDRFSNNPNEFIFATDAAHREKSQITLWAQFIRFQISVANVARLLVDEYCDPDNLISQKPRIERPHTHNIETPDGQTQKHRTQAIGQARNVM